ESGAHEKSRRSAAALSTGSRGGEQLCEEGAGEAGGQAMTDIFLSYSSKDREKVRPIRDALAAAGYDVFWDQEVPTGVNWNKWIMDHLGRSRLVVVAWSKNSAASDNVIHEATIAREDGKLAPCLLEALATRDFPMGFYTTQAAS